MLNRLRRRRRKSDRAQADPPSGLGASPVDLASLGPDVSEAVRSGAVDQLGALIRAARPGIDGLQASVLELRLRHASFSQMKGATGTGRSTAATDREVPDPAVGALPEIDSTALTVDNLGSSIRGNGALVVRGLVSGDFCAAMRLRIDSALANLSTPPAARDPRWYTPLTDLDGAPTSPTYRAKGYVMFDGQVPVADAPEAASAVLAEFASAGVPQLAAAYLGAPAALSLEKWTLRRVPPRANTSWHQDGAFLGSGINTVNLWIALSDCGLDASGLDIVAKRFDRIVDTGTPGSYFDWDVAPDVVEKERAGSPIVSPVFRAGDAVFFDQMLLHRTSIKPGMTRDRYALESWFFTPLSLPTHYAGILC